MATIAGDGKDDCVLATQPCAGDHQVNTFGRTDHWPGVPLVQLAHAVCPDAGSVDDDPRSRFDLPPACFVHDVSTDDTPPGFHQPHHGGVVDYHRAVEVGSPGDCQRQAGIIHLSVVVAGDAEQPPSGDQRFASLHLRWVQPAVALDVTEEA